LLRQNVHKQAQRLCWFENDKVIADFRDLLLQEQLRPHSVRNQLPFSNFPFAQAMTARENQFTGKFLQEPY
jgi:hypothetical protein